MAADLPKIQRSLERGTKWISHFIWNKATFQPEAKMTKWILNCIFPCDGVVHLHQDWLWWLGCIQGVCICVCQFKNHVKWRLSALTKLSGVLSYLDHLSHCLNVFKIPYFNRSSHKYTYTCTLIVLKAKWIGSNNIICRVLYVYRCINVDNSMDK